MCSSGLPLFAILLNIVSVLLTMLTSKIYNQLFERDCLIRCLISNYSIFPNSSFSREVSPLIRQPLNANVRFKPCAKHPQPHCCAMASAISGQNRALSFGSLTFASTKYLFFFLLVLSTEILSGRSECVLFSNNVSS